MALETYTTKRDFSRTPEPRGGEGNPLKQLRFVVQRHQASKLHYDFRLEMDGVLKSWAVPRGPSMNPADKRLAVQVEDHPVSYGTFEGDIPAGNYGAGHVDIWDEGTYRVAGTTNRSESEKQLLQGLENGSVGFVLDGGKLRGGFTLVRMKGRQKGAWLLIKKDDQDASHDRYDSEEHLGEIQPGNSPVPVKAKSSRGKKEAKAGEAEMPHPVKPMMAKLAAAPFDGEDWVFETKWDGYRAIAEARAGRVELYSRSGKSYGDTYQPILDGLQKLGNEAVLDGEIVVLDNGGSPSFQQLQNYQNSPSDHLCYYAFVLLYLNGWDLRDLPLLERKQRLEELLWKELSAVRYSTHVAGRGKECFQEAQRKNMEGIMAKKADSPYRTGRRSSEWLKIKTHLRQEAVIGSFTEPKSTRKHLGHWSLAYTRGINSSMWAGVARDSMRGIWQC